VLAATESAESSKHCSFQARVHDAPVLRAIACTFPKLPAEDPGNSPAAMSLFLKSADPVQENPQATNLLVANSLCGGQEQRTMREPEA
jgi:hypothetical protein